MTRTITVEMEIPSRCYNCPFSIADHNDWGNGFCILSRETIEYDIFAYSVDEKCPFLTKKIGIVKVPIMKD